jgi:hypothetical protein
MAHKKFFIFSFLHHLHVQQNSCCRSCSCFRVYACRMVKQSLLFRRSPAGSMAYGCLGLRRKMPLTNMGPDPAEMAFDAPLGEAG